MVNSNYEDSELTSKIIGCATQVHRKVGCGFQEVIYQRSLAVELKKAGIDFELEFEMPIYYDEEHVGSRRVDILVESRIPVELKALVELEDVHLAQAKNYLEAYKLRVGLLINFGGKSLQFRRLINSKGKPGLH
jgi:GxxExxY protein